MFYVTDASHNDKYSNVRLLLSHRNCRFKVQVKRKDALAFPGRLVFTRKIDVYTCIFVVISTGFPCKPMMQHVSMATCT